VKRPYIGCVHDQITQYRSLTYGHKGCKGSASFLVRYGTIGVAL